jgi:hypothetical protein
MKKRVLFNSTIPSAAEARIVSRHSSGAPAAVDYVVDAATVGTRWSDADGSLTTRRQSRFNIATASCRGQSPEPKIPATVARRLARPPTQP